MDINRQLKESLEAFLEFNEDRKKKAIQIAPQLAPIALHVVPVLLHYNLPQMPCCMESEGVSECGITNFELTDQIKKTVSRELEDYKTLEMSMKRFELEKPLIESLILMGSVGTAAQSDKSDFDYWVVVNESDLTDKQIKFLQKKLELIEEWADKKGAEVHFFITDVEKVRENNYGGASKESVGSSQAALLKEEFYRTLLHVAGKYPAWWLVPPAASDEVYKKTLEALSKSWNPSPKQFVDLGNMAPIAMDEYFGAALWQINKAMDSPFKSVMKMAVLESFIDSQGESMLLCDELKKNILSRNAPPHALDPYLILINRLLDYYEIKKRSDVVDLIRQCVYNKVHIKLSSATRRKPKKTFKEEVMLHYINEWKWSDAVAEHMNDYEYWDFAQVLALGNRLHSFLIETYKNLTDLLSARKDATTMISDEDLTVLGRKLFAFYNRKPHKVELVKRASDEALRQESCTFMPVVQMGKKTVWTVFRGNVTTEIARKQTMDHAILKKGKSLAEIIAWLAANRLVSSSTFMHLIPNPLPISLQAIQELFKVIEQFMPYKPISAIEQSRLLSDAFVERLIVIVNLTSQPWVKTVEEVALLYRNSYGETFCETYDSKKGLSRLMEILSQMKPDSGTGAHNLFKVYIPRADSSAKIEKQVRNVILNNLKNVRSA